MTGKRLSRFLVVAALVLTAAGIAAVSARADSPDVKVTSPAPGQHPFETGTATVDTATGHVTVTLIGGWSWPTHGDDCNTDRAGAGIAVNWFDPQDRGFHVGFFNVSGGTTDTTAGGPDDFGVGATGANGLNPADDVVHPTENDTGDGAVVDITDPSNFADWRGGCGVFSSDTVLVNNQGTLSYTTEDVAHGNFGKATPSSVDFSGTPFNDPTPPSDPSLQGAVLQHVYASKADVTKVCALTYDVHPGTKAADNDGVGIPGQAKEVTAGQNAVAPGASYSGQYNGDNSIQGNNKTPAGNSCPAFTFPNNPTIKTALSESSGKSGDKVHDSAELDGATANAGGTVTYSVYSDASCSSKFADAGTVTVTNGTVPQSNFVTFPHAGTFYWQASYSGDANNTSALSPCSSEQLVIAPVVDLSIVKSASPTQITLGSGNITWTIVVTNHGPDTDDNVTVNDPLPAGTTFVSVSTTKGSCTGGAIISCSLGTMAAGESVTITLVTTPTRAGTLVNNVTVVGSKPEVTTNNNSSSASAVVNEEKPPPLVFCTAVSKVTPKQLFVGRKTTLTIHLTKNQKAVKGVRVRIKGAGLNKLSKPSNAKGVIKQSVKMKKAGILTFTPVASKKCNTKRVGVTGVFTPPVTG
jgi:uncharacterized repeat protein (TIGR01451 family)